MEQLLAEQKRELLRHGDEWAQLREMEQLLAEQKRELLRHGIPESDDKGWN